MPPLWIEEAHQDLIKDDLVEHLDPGLAGDSLGEAPDVAAAAIHEFDYTRAAERSAAYTAKPRREVSGFQSSASSSWPSEWTR